jgi:WD40 repeat protein/tetratricopeptide (TPR) repeat protein
VYDRGTATPARTVPLPAGANQNLAHHPHRPELAVGLPDRVAVLDLTTGEEIGSLPVHGGQMAWHPGGELLSVTAEGHVNIWDVPRRRQAWRLENTGSGTEGHFNRTGDLLVTRGWDGRVRLWNPHAGREVLATTGGYARFGPGDRLDLRFPASAADPAGPLTVVEPAREYRTLVPGDGLVQALWLTAAHPGGRLAAVSTQGGLSLVDLASGTERAFVPGPGVRTLLFEPDGSLLVKAESGLIRWPVADGPAGLRVGPPELVPVPAWGETVACSADGKVLAVSEGPYGASVWRRDRPSDALRLPHADCRHVTVSPDGTLVATGSWSHRGIKVWEAATGRLVRDLVPDQAATIPAFSPNGRWLANRNGGQRWRTADWSEGAKAPAGTVYVGFSPDGRLAAWCGKGFVAVTDAETGREVVRLEDPHQDGLVGATFSPDGALLMGSTNDSHCVRVWDLRKIRAGLAGLGLDWDAPPYPAGSSPDPAAAPLAVRVVGADLFADPARLVRARREQTLAALWLNPFDPDARLALGDELLRANRPAEAAAQFTASLAFRPDQAGGYLRRAVARFRTRDWKGCVADAGAALARHPADRDVRWYRAQSLLILGRPADAVTDLTALVEYYPDDPGAHSDRAEAYLALGRAADAVADLNRAAGLARETTHPFILNNIAWRLVTGPPEARDPKRGLELARWADARRPNDPVVSNTLGVALYRAGQYADAVPVLERSLAAGKGAHDAHDLFFLAMCHARLGDPAAARECYARGAVAALASALRPALAGEVRAVRDEARGVLHAAGIATEAAPMPREANGP